MCCCLEHAIRISLLERLVTFPYPRTIWCHTPPEDATNAPLCRPLPVSYFPPPGERSPLPPVGAQGWQEARTPTAPTYNPWGRGAPQSNARNIVNRSHGTPLTSTSPPANPTNRNGARPSACMTSPQLLDTEADCMIPYRGSNQHHEPYCCSSAHVWCATWTSTTTSWRSKHPFGNVSHRTLVRVDCDVWIYPGFFAGWILQRRRQYRRHTYAIRVP